VTENAGQERAQTGERHESALIVEQEVRGKIVVAAMNAGARLSRGEFAFDIVIAEFPVGAVDLGAHDAQGFEEFEQADVFVAIALENRKGIVGGVGVNGHALFLGSAEQEKR